MLAPSADQLVIGTPTIKEVLTGHRTARVVEHSWHRAGGVLHHDTRIVRRRIGYSVIKEEFYD
jgi:hypothetical protein